MNAYRAKPLTYPWPTLVYASATLAAFGLGRLSPIPIAHSHGWAPWIAGSALVFFAVALDIWAMRTLIDRHTTVAPTRCASHLVTCGPFRFVRNPIYLGYTILLAGLGLITLNAWFIIMAALSVAVMTSSVVRCEEEHLLSRFGIEFERYRHATSRWI